MSYRILVVDDEPSIVRLMEFVLAKQGHHMIVATNGEEAIKKAHDERPDLILLDVMMPRLDGYEVARTLRSDTDSLLAATPIIMLSAKAQEADVARGRDIGVDAYITKPFAPDHLVNVVKEFLARRSQ